MKHLSLICVLVGLLLGYSHAQIIINEISYNPPESGNDSLEYIELYNAGPDAVNMSGWHFTAGVVDTFPDIVLGAGEFFVSAINAGAMQNVFGISVHQWKSGALSNSGELVALANAEGEVVNSVLYGNSSPWPTDPNGRGPSLELISPDLDNSDPVNWKASEGRTGIIINNNEVSGTPGAPNQAVSGPSVTITLANNAFHPNIAVVRVGDQVRWVNNEDIEYNVNGNQSTYPGNPESFGSGDPATGPWEFEHIFQVPGIYHYQCDPHVHSGMTGIVYVYDPETYNDFGLATIRQVDENGLALFDNVPVTATAVVHGINFQPPGYSFYIINPDNVGINVFSFNEGDYTVMEGDLVRVSGVLDQFNGLLELIPDEIELLSTGNSWTNPEEVTEVTEEWEASHIFITGIEINSIEETGISGYNILATHINTGNEILIRVDADLGIVPSLEAMAVRGIGIQFDPTLPFTEGYQILALEFDLGESAVTHLPPSAIRVFPNPAQDVVYLETERTISRVEVYALDGRLVSSQIPGEADVTRINVAHLASGMYILKAETPEGIWSNMIQVKN